MLNTYDINTQNQTHQGIKWLSIRELAQSVGYKTSTLYNKVRLLPSDKSGSWYIKNNKKYMFDAAYLPEIKEWLIKTFKRGRSKHYIKKNDPNLLPVKAMAVEMGCKIYRIYSKLSDLPVSKNNVWYIQHGKHFYFCAEYLPEIKEWFTEHLKRKKYERKKPMQMQKKCMSHMDLVALNQYLDELTRFLDQETNNAKSADNKCSTATKNALAETDTTKRSHWLSAALKANRNAAKHMSNVKDAEADIKTCKQLIKDFQNAKSNGGNVELRDAKFAISTFLSDACNIQTL